MIEDIALERTGNIRHHTTEDCDGPPCPFHSPTQHAMVDARMHLRETGLIERICEHGVGHPDPDSVAFFDRHGRPGFDIHGCDGCCWAAA